MNTFKLLVSTALVFLIFLTPQAIHGMERFSKNEEQKDPPGIRGAEEAEEQHFNEHQETLDRMTTRELRVDTGLRLYNLLSSAGITGNLLSAKWNSITHTVTILLLIEDEKRLNFEGPTSLSTVTPARIAFYNLNGWVKKHKMAQAWGFPIEENTPPFVWIKTINRAIKDDLIETMELYQDLHGEPHPRWADIRRQLRLPVCDIYCCQPTIHRFLDLFFMD